MVAPLTGLGLAACSYNANGTSTSEIMVTEGAVVSELHGRGLHVATLHGSTILNIGSYHEVLVFTRECGDHPTSPPSRSELMENRETFATVTDNMGLEIAAGRRWTGITLGRHQAVVLVDSPPDAEIARSLYLDLEDLTTTSIDTPNANRCIEETIN